MLAKSGVFHRKFLLGMMEHESILFFFLFLFKKYQFVIHFDGYR